MLYERLFGRFLNPTKKNNPCSEKIQIKKVKTTNTLKFLST